MTTTLTDYEPEISWDAHLRRYIVEVVLDTGREQLVYDTLKEAQNYRIQYLADIQLLLTGQNAVHGSGAVL